MILGMMFMNKAGFQINMRKQKNIINNEIISCKFNKHQDRIIEI